MFYSESLLAKEGPLAQVWLAANLERKLSKHQFIQSNIAQSTQAIVKATSENDDSEALALRLSGQLLYGVVRIYSRKAKYLLDDVSDALLKLKSAFRSSSNTITLPVNATIVSSVNQLILQDTVTQSDLLYQEPLTFDEEPSTNTNFFGNYDMEDTTIDSIELPRTQVDELDNLQNDDLDIDLNFDIDENINGPDNNDGPLDLSFDDSIEVGRAENDANLSQNYDEYDQSLDIDLGPWEDQPIDIVEPENNGPIVIEKPVRKPRAPRVSTAGQRRIVSDSEIEIPIQSFSNTEEIVVHQESEELNLNVKRLYIDSLLKENNYVRHDIARSLLSVRAPKRQKIAASTPLSDDLPELEHSGDENVENNNANDMYDYDQGIDIDFGWDDANAVPNNENEQEQQLEEEEVVDDFNSNHTQDGVSESTSAIASHIGSLFKEKSSVTFTDIIEKDSLSGKPLSNIPKSEATRVFFELLVLGSNDALELKQTELFGEVQVKQRVNLQKFL